MFTYLLYVGPYACTYVGAYVGLYVRMYVVLELHFIPAKTVWRYVSDVSDSYISTKQIIIIYFFDMHLWVNTIYILRVGCYIILRYGSHMQENQ